MQTAAKSNQQPQIGDFIEGGFFAGVININGQLFGIAVAPKAEGEKEPTTWGKLDQHIEAASCYDGAANTAAMAEAGSELAQWALGLNINGYSDWYIPSRDELELIYRNLKPTQKENWASFRDGDNPSSAPAGYPYTKTEPARTTAPNFQNGEAEAFEESWYWASTQYSADGAWLQDFVNGYQLYVRKDDQGRARAVRRFISYSSI